MKILISFFALLTLVAAPAFANEAPKSPPPIEIAKDPTKLTVGQVLQIASALSQMNCGQKVLKDGAKESMGCEPYGWSPGIAWMIAGNLHKAQEVVQRYAKVRTEVLAAVPRKADGTIAPEDDTKFGVRDSALQDQDAMITLEHFKRGDLEPMKLPPNVLAGLWAITD